MLLSQWAAYTLESGLPALTEAEEAAAVRLTIDRFHTWAVRGWWSYQPEGDTP